MREKSMKSDLNFLFSNLFTIFFYEHT